MESEAETKFFEEKKKEVKEKEEGRADKHLLPNDKIFKQYPKIPFGDIDLIFNHENVWSNLQNNDPTMIYYHLHDDEKWLPFVKNLNYPHVKQKS